MLDFFDRPGLINTLLQQGGRTVPMEFNRFSGFPRTVAASQTAKAVEPALGARGTALKRGVNGTACTEEI